MAVFRMYTGDDGETHLEEQNLDSHPLLKEPQTTQHIVFREMEPGRFVDWHPAPQRQYVIILAGEMEIGFGDGTTRRRPRLSHWARRSARWPPRRCSHAASPSPMTRRPTT